MNTIEKRTRVWHRPNSEETVVELAYAGSKDRPEVVAILSLSRTSTGLPKLVLWRCEGVEVLGAPSSQSLVDQRDRYAARVQDLTEERDDLLQEVDRLQKLVADMRTYQRGEP